MNIHCYLIFSGFRHSAHHSVHRMVHHTWHAHAVGAKIRRVATIVCVAVGVGAPIGGGIAGAGYLSADGHLGDLAPSFFMGPGAPVATVPAVAQAFIPAPELATLPAPPDTFEQGAVQAGPRVVPSENLSGQPITVPEPASFLLFATGLAGLALLRRRARA